jgi:hypothetical protein
MCILPSLQKFFRELFIRFNRSSLEFVQIVFKKIVHATQKTHCRVILFREMEAVYCENHTKHINTLYGQNSEFLNVEDGGACTFLCALKG